ncbi:Fic/DOC family protein [Litorimonas haliclonae]|uniref:Fic/DOC family protein n=1 Tax=Litorimonas haliclonae TaxID=2081977 RepID=UPI0039EDFFD9
MVLAQIETAITEQAAFETPTNKMKFSPEGFKKLHGQIFGGVYPWAGDFRNVDMAKHIEGDKRIHFEKGVFVKTSMERLCGELSHDLKSTDGFKTKDKKQFAHRASVYLADLNFIHPFPEGNGRIQRLFLQNLAERSDFSLNYNKLRKSSWIEASIDSYKQPVMGAHREMGAVIEGAISERILSKSKDKKEEKLKYLRQQIKNNDRDNKDRGR